MTLKKQVLEKYLDVLANLVRRAILEKRPRLEIEDLQRENNQAVVLWEHEMLKEKRNGNNA